MRLECAGFESETCGLVDAEHDVHILHGLTNGALQEVVNAGNHEELILVLLYIDHGLVGVDHLLEVGTLSDEMGEGGILVVVGIDLLHLFQGLVALRIGGDEDAARKAAALGDEQHTTVVAGSQFLHRLVDLQQVLVGEGLVNRTVIVAPREMGGGPGLLSGTGAAGDTVDMDIAADNAGLQGRQHGQLDTSGKAAGVSQVLGLADGIAMGLRQSVDVVVRAGDAEVLCQIDNLHVGGDGVLLEEGLALAVAEAEEDHVDLVERHLVGELQVGLAYESLMDVAHGVACVALRIGKDDLCPGMVEQHTDEFTTSVACSSQYSNLYSFHCCSRY